MQHASQVSIAASRYCFRCYTNDVNTREYLPSGQFLLIAGAVVVSAGLIFFVAWGRRESPTPLIPAQGSVEQLPDTDGDSIKDWEELLRGTDPAMPDTDGDGTRDGDEIALARDPLRQGPDDAAEVSRIIPPDFSLVMDEDTDNLTKSLSQNLFASYIGTFGKDLQGDPYTQQRVASDLLSKVTLDPRGVVYQSGDLPLVGDKPEFVRTFGNEIIRVVGRHREASFATAAIALAGVVDTGGAGSVEDLISVGEAYDALVDDLLLVPTPSSLAPLYAETLTSLSRTAGAFQDLATIFDDPLRALAGLRAYQGHLAETTRLFTLIAMELDNKGILFKEGEAGFAWRKLRASAP